MALTECVELPPVPPMPGDALSNPTGDALLPQLLAVLPRGSAWRTDYVADADDNSFLHRYWRAVAEPVADLYAKAWELALQSTACTVSSGLTDWEAEFGLPDPCVAPATNDIDRIAALREKVAGEGGGSIPYFVCVAARLGYDITITEPHFFEFGISSFEGGGLVPSYFEFGASAFGDQAFSDFTGTSVELTDAFAPDFQSYWIVNVLDAVPNYFEFGASSLGYDRFSDFASDLDLECVFNARKPGHTTLIFNYSGAPA